MIKFIIVFAIIFFVLYMVTLPLRRHRAETADDRRRSKAHNGRIKIRYKGFETSEDDRGRRVVHTNERDGKDNCSSNCKHCKAGEDYRRNKLQVFDDRPVRGFGSRRQQRADRDG